MVGSQARNITRKFSSSQGDLMVAEAFEDEGGVAGV